MIQAHKFITFFLLTSTKILCKLTHFLVSTREILYAEALKADMPITLRRFSKERSFLS